MSDRRSDDLHAAYANVARAYAEALSDELASKPLDRAFLQAFSERVTTGLIVDVGCGPGHIARFVAALGRQVEGIDLSPEMIATAIERHPTLPFRVGDMFALPYATASIGGIVAFYAIVHAQAGELAPAFRELARVLVPGGLIALAFHVGHETVHVDELFGCATSLDFVFHEPAEVIAGLTAAGLTLEARLDRQPYPGVEHPSERTYLLARK